MADDDGKVVIDSDVEKPLSDLEKLDQAFERVAGNIAKGGAASARSIITLTNEVERLGEEGKLTEDEIEKYNQQILAMIPAAAKSREATEKLQRSIQIQGKGLRDFAKDLGLPLDALALYGVALSSVKTGLNILEKEGMVPASRAFKDAAHDTEVLRGAAGALSNILRGDLIGALKAVTDASAKYIEITDAILTAQGKSGEGVRKILEDRRNEREEMEKQAVDLGKLIALEQARGEVTDDTRKRVDALVKKYGDELPAAFLRTIDTLGQTQEQIDATNKMMMAQGDEIARQQEQNLKQFTQTREALDEKSFAIQEGIGLLKLEGKVSVEEAKKVTSALFDQLEAYRSVGEEIPASIIATTQEWVNQRIEIGADTKEIKERVTEMVIAYKRAGDEIPKELQDIVDQLHVVVQAQDLVSEGAKRIIDDIVDSDVELKQGADDLLEAIEAVRKDGELTAEVAEDFLERIVDQMNAFRKVGKEVPPALEDVAYELGVLIKEHQHLQENLEANRVGYLALVDTGLDAMGQLNKAIAEQAGALESLFDDFEGLPDDGTVLGDDNARERRYRDQGRGDGEAYGEGFSDGAARGGASSSGGSSGGGSGSGRGGGPMGPNDFFAKMARQVGHPVAFGPNDWMAYFLNRGKGGGGTGAGSGRAGRAGTAAPGAAQTFGDDLFNRQLYLGLGKKIQDNQLQLDTTLSRLTERLVERPTRGDDAIVRELQGLRHDLGQQRDDNATWFRAGAGSL